MCTQIRLWSSTILSGSLFVFVCMTMHQLMMLFRKDRLRMSTIQYYSSTSLLRMMCTLIRP